MLSPALGCLPRVSSVQAGAGTSGVFIIRILAVALLGPHIPAEKSISHMLLPQKLFLHAQPCVTLGHLCSLVQALVGRVAVGWGKPCLQQAESCSFMKVLFIYGFILSAPALLPPISLLGDEPPGQAHRDNPVHLKEQ